MPLGIVHYNDPVLRKKGAKVAVFDAALAKFAADMVEAMHEAGGIGLAAQQVGEARQICVVDLSGREVDFSWRLDGSSPPLELIMPMVLVNPVLEFPPPPREVLFEEGCLSFPAIRGDVPRPDAVVVRFQDENGVAHQLECDGLLARCIQHEHDHLQGILFIDRMAKAARAALAEPLQELARQTEAERKK